MSEAVEPLRLNNGPKIDCVTIANGPFGVESDEGHAKLAADPKDRRVAVKRPVPVHARASGPLRRRKTSSALRGNKLDAAEVLLLEEATSLSSGATLSSGPGPGLASIG